MQLVSAKSHSSLIEEECEPQVHFYLYSANDEYLYVG
jgi:hypothetical protein